MQEIFFGGLPSVWPNSYSCVSCLLPPCNSGTCREEKELCLCVLVLVITFIFGVPLASAFVPLCPRLPLVLSLVWAGAKCCSQTCAKRAAAALETFAGEEPLHRSVFT